MERKCQAPWATVGGDHLRFHVRSYRNGLQILESSPAYEEIARVLASIRLETIDAARKELQATYETKAKAKGGPPRKAGIQTGLNKILREHLTIAGWRSEVPVFNADSETEKGVWTMDFAKSFPKARMTIGVEVTFNHGEALTWTPLRLALAHEAEDVLPDARINVGCIIIGTDHLKGDRRRGLRMDSAVGTFERLITVLPKMRAVLPAPLVIFGLDWEDGGIAGDAAEIDLHSSAARTRPLFGSSSG